MPERDDKRMLRNLKRVIKREGTKHRRQAFKKGLRENPEEAHLAEEDFGGHESEPMNGLDRPSGPAPT